VLLVLEVLVDEPLHFAFGRNFELFIGEVESHLRVHLIALDPEFVLHLLLRVHHFSHRQLVVQSLPLSSLLRTSFRTLQASDPDP